MYGIQDRHGDYGENAPGLYRIPTEHGYIYNQATIIYEILMLRTPSSAHFEGITSGVRANTYNLVADSIGIDGSSRMPGPSPSMRLGVATWTKIARAVRRRAVRGDSRRIRPMAAM